eukprot:124995-Rhodomonas_salina.1
MPIRRPRPHPAHALRFSAGKGHTCDSESLAWGRKQDLPKKRRSPPNLCELHRELTELRSHNAGKATH